MGGRVSDAGASRAGSLSITVGEGSRDTSSGRGVFAEPGEAEFLGLGLEAFFDQSTITVIVLTVRVLPSGSRCGECAEENGALHVVPFFLQCRSVLCKSRKESVPKLESI